MNRFFFFLTLTIFSSCVILEKPSIISLKKLSPDEILNNHKEKKINYSWLTASAKGSLQINENQLPLIAQFRLKKDSIIWVSVSSPLGLEVIRLKLNKDSLHIINRINKTFSVYDMDNANNIFGISSFESAQDLLVGSFNSNAKNWQSDLNPLKNHYKLINRNTKQSSETTIFINDSFLLTLFNFSIKNNQINAVYKDYDYFENIGYLPKNIGIYLQANDTLIKAKIKYSNIKFNIPKKISFVVPKSYSKIH